MIEMCKWMPLTPEQQQFAAEHHGLLLKFMGTHGLDDDYYSILAERYVKTVKLYWETPKLQQYAFSTILWYRLYAELYKVRKRNMKLQNRYFPEGNEEIIGHCDDLRGNALWSEIGSLVTQQQMELLRLRACGFTPAEIARIQNCSGNAIHCRFKRIKRKLQRAGII